MRHPAYEDAEDRWEGLISPVSPRHRSRDVVFDFGGRDVPDIRDLTILVTARMLAERQNRVVWVRALPERSWDVLEALGLAHLFRFFPAGSSADN